MTHASVLALAALMAPPVLSACVASEVCADRGRVEALSSSTLSGEQTFTQAGQKGDVRFRATLRGLSELWPAEHPVTSAGLDVVLHLAYAGASETDGVATQMPRFGVNLAGAASTAASYAYATPAFPPPTGVFFHFRLFSECYVEGDTNCCEYGSTECSSEVVLRFERQEGEPFPPVVLRWEASVRASIDTCPPVPDAEVALEVVQP